MRILPLLPSQFSNHCTSLQFSLLLSEADDEMDYKNRKDDEIYLAHPRKKIPQPIEYEPLNAKMSPIPQAKPEKKLDESLDISNDESKEMSTDEELGVMPLEV